MLLVILLHYGIFGSPIECTFSCLWPLFSRGTCVYSQSLSGWCYPYVSSAIICDCSIVLWMSVLTSWALDVPVCRGCGISGMAISNLLPCLLWPCWFVVWLSLSAVSSLFIALSTSLQLVILLPFPSSPCPLQSSVHVAQYAFKLCYG